ncbi:MAG TPA: adenine deaminase [Cytophagales bacterium]|nr:adenine deaminase [Cytophagales bacterium]HAA17989.1 adenine deaminase [Cytophagales bacterium]HAP64734.1 adenine deaminase [Cytophagales bacterium]
MPQRSGQIVDIRGRHTYPGTITWEDGRIVAIEETDHAPNSFIMPGFIDAHVHIESSMLVPAEFARLAVVHGTVATVSDPHEIANVLGMEGVRYMIDNARQVPFKFFFGAPSCVPATAFETAGATISAEDIEELFEKDGLLYLAEMMNWPGVIFEDEGVYKKLEVAKRWGKPIDGHAPGLLGEQAKKYASAGISTDHECFTLNEAAGKLALGMKVLIREGSAAKNFEALIDLLPAHFENLMFCSDDKHPDNLIVGHINELCSRAIAKGMDVYKVLQVACLNPTTHYGLPVGQLRVGDPADFIVVNSLSEFKVEATYLEGQQVSEGTTTLLPRGSHESINQFVATQHPEEAFQVPATGTTLRIMQALDGQLITKELHEPPTVVNGLAVADPNRDLLKLAVVNRYQSASPSLAFIRNFQLKRGALASSVGHDSHNILAVGCTDKELARAVQALMDSKGGLAVVEGEKVEVLPLPVAGLMSTEDGYTVAKQYEDLDAKVKALGCTLGAPFMTLSFMALLVIPQLKLSDKGLFDGETFQFSNLWVD